MTVLSVWEKEKAENLFPSCSRTRVWESLGPITDEQQPNTALSPPSNIDQYPVFFCLFPTHSSSHMSLSSGSRSESKGWLDKILISVRMAASGGKRFWARTHPTPFPSAALRALMRAATGRITVAPLPPQGSQEPTWCHTDPLSLSHMLSPSYRKEWPWLHGVQSSHSQGLRTVDLTWMMIPFSLYSACSALENVHTKAWNKKEKHLRTWFSLRANLLRFQRTPRELALMGVS